MTSINTNITSLRAQRTLGQNNADLATRLERLSTGLKVNTGKDGPAALIASENMRSELAGIRQAIDNSTRASNVINTAEGALAEINALLLQVQSLTNEAANTGGLSSGEIEANQLQVDAILGSINRISNTTQFNGRQLLNGQLDYQMSGIVASQAVDVKVNSVKLPDNGSQQVAVEVTGSAQTARLEFNAAWTSGNVTLEIGGNRGVQQISFGSTTVVSAMAYAINQLTDATGVSATVSGGQLAMDSVGYGAKQFVTVEAISGPFTALSGNKDFGVDTEVNINGSVAEADGLTVRGATGNMDIEITLDAGFAQQTATTATFDITGGGTTFQVGSTVQAQSQIDVGIGSVATSRLGDNVSGFLNELASGGMNSLVSGNTVQAQRILESAITEVATMRGRLGALQKSVLETNVNSLQIALENVTSAESAIRDADFAFETAALTRAQILTQANTTVLAQANQSPQQVLALLQG
jgi:flagellin